MVSPPTPFTATAFRHPSSSYLLYQVAISLLRSTLVDMASRSPALAHAPYAAAAAALLCTFALLSGFAQADCGGFASSCSGIGVSAQGFMTCICSNGPGRGFSRSGLDLNARIGNKNGNLVDGAKFASSCRNIRWYKLGGANQGVNAECIKKDGKLGSTTFYNVQRRVANYNGNLAWNNCRRRSLLEVAATLPSPRKMLNHA